MSGPYNGRWIDWTGYLFYNGFRFPSQLRLRVETTPQLDAGKRMTKYVRYVFFVDFVVTDQDWISSTGGPDSTNTSDTNMEIVRQRLAQTGAEFKFNGQGFGGLWVNRGRGCGPLHAQPSDTSQTAPIPVVDAIFGPHPQVMVCEPLGSNKAWRVTWTCEVTVPECCGTRNNPASPWGLYELTYDQSWTIDEGGMTIRTTTASVEMPGYRISSGTALLDIVDKYREVFFPAIPLGFLRTQTFSMDRAKRRLEIVILDREVPSDVPFWPNTVNMSIVFSVDGNPFAANWGATCSGAITLAPGIPKWYAFTAFAAVFLDRFNRGNAIPQLIPLINEKGESETHLTGASILTRVAFTEDLFSRTITFDFEWDLITTLNSLFQSSGMLQGLAVLPTGSDPSTAWAAWHNSIWNNVQNQRGYAQLNNPQLAAVDLDDSLNGPCDQGGVSPLNPQGVRTFGVYTSFQTPITYTSISKQHSYLDYKYAFKIYRDSNVAYSDNIQTVSANEVAPPNPGPPSGNFLVDGITAGLISQWTKASAQSQTTDQQSQVRGPSRYFLIYYGCATRLGFSIPQPKVTAIAGGVPIFKGGFSDGAVLGKTLTGAIHGRQWYFVYELPFVPTGDILVDITHDGNSVGTVASLGTLD